MKWWLNKIGEDTYIMRGGKQLCNPKTGDPCGRIIEVKKDGRNTLKVVFESGYSGVLTITCFSASNTEFSKHFSKACKSTADDFVSVWNRITCTQKETENDNPVINLSKKPSTSFEKNPVPKRKLKEHEP